MSESYIKNHNSNNDRWLVRASIGLSLFLLFFVLYNIAMTNEFIGVCLERTTAVISTTLNHYFGEQTKVVFHADIGYRIVLTEGVGRETKVIYDFAYLNYPFIFLYMALVIVWLGSVLRKTVVIALSTPVILFCCFLLMICAYYVEIYAPMHFSFFKSWGTQILVSSLCIAIHYVFLIRPMRLGQIQGLKRSLRSAGGE